MACTPTPPPPAPQNPAAPDCPPLPCPLPGDTYRRTQGSAAYASLSRPAHTPNTCNSVQTAAWRLNAAVVQRIPAQALRQGQRVHGHPAKGRDRFRLSRAPQRPRVTRGRLGGGRRLQMLEKYRQLPGHVLPRHRHRQLRQPVPLHPATWHASHPRAVAVPHTSGRPQAPGVNPIYRRAAPTAVALIAEIYWACIPRNCGAWALSKRHCKVVLDTTPIGQLPANPGVGQLGNGNTVIGTGCVRDREKVPGCGQV